MTFIPPLPSSEAKPGPQAPAMSRQRRWQINRRAAGLCVKCGQPALPGLSQCAIHNEADKAKARDRYWNGGDKAKKSKAYVRAVRAAKKAKQINPSPL